MGLPGRSYGTDLFMHMMIAAGSDTGGPDKAAQYLNQLVSNCKFFFFAGQHTLASVMSYTLLMLARHPEWQDRARKEVLETISSEEVYDISVLSRLKTVSGDV
jgi:cytochrome P450